MNILPHKAGPIILVLCTLLGTAPAFAQDLEKKLTASRWSMDRNTGLGKVTTEMQFYEGGTGKVTRTALKNNITTPYSNSFSYSISNDRVIIQEEIEDQWKGHFGVTRWRLTDGNLIHDVNFRDEVITLIPSEKTVN